MSKHQFAKHLWHLGFDERTVLNVSTKIVKFRVVETALLCVNDKPRFPEIGSHKATPNQRCLDQNGVIASGKTSMTVRQVRRDNIVPFHVSIQQDTSEILQFLAISFLERQFAVTISCEVMVDLLDLRLGPTLSQLCDFRGSQ